MVGTKETAGLTSHLHIRVSTEASEVLEKRAAEAGLSITVYLRGILERDAISDPDERFVQQFMAWWGSRGQGDPSVIVGAVARAKGRGMSFATKFRMVVRQMLDQSLI
jgi:hypothetical protein